MPMPNCMPTLHYIAFVDRHHLTVCMSVVQADTQGSRDYRSGADLPSPLGGVRPVPRGPVELAAAVLRRIAPWTRSSQDSRGSGGGSGDSSDDIDAMLQHDAAEVSAMPTVRRASQSCCSLLTCMTFDTAKTHLLLMQIGLQ